MKRVGIALIVCVLLSGVMAQGHAAAADKNASTISVTGQAKIAVTPNIAYFSAGITTMGANVESARSENERIMRNIIEALVNKGIDRKKISTSQFSLQPVYQKDNSDKEQQSISAYRLQNTVTVTVEELSSLGSVIDAAFQVGANQFYGLRFAVKDDSKLKEELLRKAVQDGRHKAGIIADALGVTLGQPLSIAESGSYMPVQADSYQMMRAGAGVPVEAGLQTVSLDINMVFSIP